MTVEFSNKFAAVGHCAHCGAPDDTDEASDGGSIQHLIERLLQQLAALLQQLTASRASTQDGIDPVSDSSPSLPFRSGLSTDMPTQFPAMAGDGGCCGQPAMPVVVGGSGGSSGWGELSTLPQTKALSGDEGYQQAEQYKASLMRDFGLTDAQASGIVGNLWHESAGMNSGITQGGRIGEPNTNYADDNANGYGIAQWGGTRKQGLIDYAAQHGLPPSSPAANYGFLKQELQGGYSYVIDKVKDTNNVDDATKVFCTAFEAPSDPQLQSRLDLAHKLLG